MSERRSFYVYFLKLKIGSMNKFLDIFVKKKLLMKSLDCEDMRKLLALVILFLYFKFSKGVILQF